MDKSQRMALVRMPIIIGAAFVIIRVALELGGMNNIVPKILGVAWLDILVPIYLAFKINGMGIAKPFTALIKSMATYAIPVKLLVALSYLLAHAFRWSGPRFGVASSPTTTAFEGFVGIPLNIFVVAVVTSLLAAAVFGGITLFVVQRMGKSK
ncbi:MAG: hypothetical protein H6695_12540 [Deferribacteres bacterium]|nr:hypothetical protein [candidate division KSB1 bacterium]MCB9511010.1 hypothetical protein [Deferribacteres bacterium]